MKDMKADLSESLTTLKTPPVLENDSIWEQLDMGLPTNGGS